MRTAIFVDGKTFYGGWRERAQAQRIHFGRLVEWLIARAGGGTSTGVHYYTSIAPAPEGAPDSEHRLNTFLDMLEAQRGYRIHRYQRRIQSPTCDACGAPVRVWNDAEVELAMTADAVRLAALGAFDRAVFVSPSVNLFIAAEAIANLGRPVVVATWGVNVVAGRLRRAAFDVIDLNTGLTAFGTDPAAGPDPDSLAIDDDDVAPSLLRAFVEQLRAAQERFEAGYVGANYFVTRWRGADFDATAFEKRRALDRLVREGVIELYDAGSDKAIRLVAGASLVERTPAPNDDEEYDEEYEYDDDELEDDPLDDDDAP